MVLRMIWSSRSNLAAYLLAGAWTLQLDISPWLVRIFGPLLGPVLLAFLKHAPRLIGIKSPISCGFKIRHVIFSQSSAELGLSLRAVLRAPKGGIQATVRLPNERQSRAQTDPHRWLAVSEQVARAKLCSARGR